MVQIPFGPPGLEPWPGYPDPEFAVGKPKLAADAAVRDRVVQASGRLFWDSFAPVPLLGATHAAEALIAHLGRGRIPVPAPNTPAMWHLPPGTAG